MPTMLSFSSVPVSTLLLLWHIARGNAASGQLGLSSSCCHLQDCWARCLLAYADLYGRLLYSDEHAYLRTASKQKQVLTSPLQL